MEAITLWNNALSPARQDGPCCKELPGQSELANVPVAFCHTKLAKLYRSQLDFSWTAQ